MIVDRSVEAHEHLAEWYALYTRHQHEKSVSRMLSQKGFEIFLPLHPVVHRWKDRTMKLDLPLFPCYVFLRGGLERRFDVLNTPGVYSLVESGGQTAVIPEKDIEAIRRVIAQNLRVEPHPYLKCGDYVRVRGGPCEGLEGILVRRKDHTSRLVISVEILQRAVAVEVDAFWVERIARQPVASLTPPPSVGWKATLSV